MRCFLIVLACGLLAALPARGEEVAKKVSIRGKISTLAPGASMLVEGVKEADTEHDKASIRFLNTVKVYKKEGKELKEAKLTDLEKGQTVEVWFVGPVAESYPVQAKAGKIVILPKEAKEEKK